MVQHTLKIKDREVQFEGELIAVGECTVTFDDSSSYHMVARAYAVEGGGYVSSLECKLPAHCGNTYWACEEIDSVHDIENFFYVFESDDIFGEGLVPLVNDREQVAKRLKRLSAKYEKMVFDFLDQVQYEAASRGSKDKAKPIPGESSFWKKLGIR
ncbi:hypothetical protein OAG71_00865 [bacterium]|nr:hypothetical protein [bacterium]